ncbi:MAG: 23S rRNA (adenine(2503)-C(2))-methyltransferase RlmN [Candidatus Aenigmarchaeota archaeon]|nr:23S rRNA (adenine(2503)-C(2))-methyltransferase RlmN [Candidatus Aenigmarchaeota archaeon]
MTYSELEEFVIKNDEPVFRAKQLQYWLYKKPAVEFDKMINLSKDFRNKLNKIAVITGSKIKQKFTGKDGTIKYLLEFSNGDMVETVLMNYEKRPNLTACISTQIGCAVGCVFCATGKKGFTRNLTAREMIEQLITIQKDTGLQVTNLVFMGQGEPLLNYNETVKAIEIINSEFKIGMRRITVSTCGIVPNIYKLTEINRQLILALSLHAPDHELRKKLMPIENKYPIDEVIKALKFFVQKTGRRVTIEYVLIDGINDNIKHAKQLNSLLKDLKYNINLIPFNPVEGCDFKRPCREKINKFKETLETANKKITVRLEKGTDISAACGHLAGIIKSDV